MNTLINSEKVISIAFTADETIRPSMITETDIIEAEQRFIQPVLGEVLCDKLREGAYTELMNEFVAPAIASWVHYIVAPLLGMRSSVCIATESCHTTSQAEIDKQHILLRRLRHKAHTLTRRLSNHLNANADTYNEYNPYTNPLNRCSINGSIVQVH